MLYVSVLMLTVERFYFSSFNWNANLKAKFGLQSFVMTRHMALPIVIECIHVKPLKRLKCVCAISTKV